jgi:hypothetical protein
LRSAAILGRVVSPVAKRSIPVRLWAVPLVLVLVAVGGVTVYFGVLFDPALCSTAAQECGGGTCCEGESTGPRDPVDPTLVQFADAVDLTTGAAPFEPTDAYVPVPAAHDVWVLDLERDGWEPLDVSGSAHPQLGFESGDATVHCFAASARGVVYADFLDDRAVFDAVAVARRAAFPEGSVYELAADPVLEHYTVDGLAVLAAEGEYTWTRTPDPQTGEASDGEWTERWGFVAVYRGLEEAVICDYGGPASAGDELDQARARLLELRLSPEAREPQ